jgi:hypothetical protein
LRFDQEVLFGKEKMDSTTVAGADAGEAGGDGFGWL